MMKTSRVAKTPKPGFALAVAAVPASFVAKMSPTTPTPAPARPRAIPMRPACGLKAADAANATRIKARMWTLRNLLRGLPSSEPARRALSIVFRLSRKAALLVEGGVKPPHSISAHLFSRLMMEIAATIPRTPPITVPMPVHVPPERPSASQPIPAPSKGRPMIT